MAKPRKTGKVPPANQPHTPSESNQPTESTIPHGAPDSDKDPKGRLGNYTTAGEHAIVQPGGKQGSDR